jgi:hypothetical protein
LLWHIFAHTHTTCMQGGSDYSPVTYACITITHMWIFSNNVCNGCSVKSAVWTCVTKLCTWYPTHHYIPIHTIQQYTSYYYMTCSICIGAYMYSLVREIVGLVCGVNQCGVLVISPVSYIKTINCMLPSCIDMENSRK